MRAGLPFTPPMATRTPTAPASSWFFVIVFCFLRSAQPFYLSWPSASPQAITCAISLSDNAFTFSNVTAFLLTFQNLDAGDMRLPVVLHHSLGLRPLANLIRPVQPYLAAMAA